MLDIDEARVAFRDGDTGEKMNARLIRYFIKAERLYR